MTDADRIAELEERVNELEAQLQAARRRSLELERLVNAHRKAEKHRQKWSAAFNRALARESPDERDVDAAAEKLNQANDAVVAAVDALFAAARESSGISG